MPSSGVVSVIVTALCGSALIGNSVECTTGNFIEARIFRSCLRISLAKAQF